MSWNQKDCHGHDDDQKKKRFWWPTSYNKNKDEKDGELIIKNIKELKRGSCLRFDLRVETKGNKECRIKFYLHNHKPFQEIVTESKGGVWQKTSVVIPPVLRGGKPVDTDVSCLPLFSPFWNISVKVPMAMKRTFYVFL